MNGQPHYRRQHERALAKIIDKIVEMLNAQELEIVADIDLNRAADESIEKIARRQDLSSRRYQLRIVKREVKKILRDSHNLLVATMVEKLDN